MKTLILQKDINDHDLGPYLVQAREEEAGLACFPEVANCGCRYEPFEAPSLRSVLEQLQGYDFHIITGIAYADERGRRNACLYYHRGSYQLYRKVNLFAPMGEDHLYVAGTEPGVFTTDIGTIGAAICYDVRFPELFDQIAKAKPSIVVIPAAFPIDRIEDWRRLLIERAKQTGAVVLGVNAVGDDGTNVFGGYSAVVEADGAVWVEADESSPTTLEVDLPVSP